MTIMVVGLGPGEGGLLTRQAWRVLSEAGTVYLRTGRHPAVNDLPATVRPVSFDHLYEAAEDFAAVYSQIVAELVEQMLASRNRELEEAGLPWLSLH